MVRLSEIANANLMLDSAEKSKITDCSLLTFCSQSVKHKFDDTAIFHVTKQDVKVAMGMLEKFSSHI
jgi:hypothetical protein